MAERTFSAISGHQPTTGSPTKISLSGSGIQCLMQIHAPFDGPPLRIVEWGWGLDDSAAKAGVQLELVEVDVGSTGGTDYKAPFALLNTALASGGTTLVPYTNAGFPGSGNYLARILNEIFEVTGGQGTNSWTVVRGVNGNSTGFTIPTQTSIMGVDVPPGDIVPDNSAGLWVPSRVAEQLAYDSGIINNTANVQKSGFNFSTLGTPVRLREISGYGMPLPNTAPFVQQKPLGREGEIAPGFYAQIRANSGSSTAGVVAYMIWAE